ncbi:MAG TPA: hypothetical protein VNG53_07340 [Bacteroidia bacterium]|nr:hypothetical protein [Bacteroidia bacterium]
MEILKQIEKIKIFRYMINIILIAPIFWLTNLIFVAVYGHYSIDSVSATAIINSLFYVRTWFAFIVFSMILVFSMLIESIILPFLTIHKSKKTINDTDIEIKQFINYLLSYFGGATINSFKEIQLDNREFLSACYKIPVAFLLYSLCLYKYHIIALILLLFTAYLFFSIYKSLIAYLK